MRERYHRTPVLGYTRIELVINEELLHWADDYTLAIDASVEAVFEATLEWFRAECGDGVYDEDF
jgi:hypothetical protein